MSLRCWHCAEPVPLEPATRVVEGRRVPTFAGLPTAVRVRPTGERDEEGRAVGRPHYAVQGVFHDLACARAHLEGLRRSGPELEELFRAYARDVWGCDPPPPALPRLMLQDYGGPYDWAEWKRRAGGDARAWGRADAAAAEGRGMGRELARAVTLQHRFGVPKSVHGAVAQPGGSDVFVYLVDQGSPRTI